MEVPLSWRKTRGGFKTEWIGYTVDLGQGLIGVSDKKVKWLKEWVAATNREGRILGRDFKAGVGRMGFLAGAIPAALLAWLVKCSGWMQWPRSRAL